MANEGLDKAVSGEYALGFEIDIETDICLLYTSPSPRDS